MSASISSTSSLRQQSSFGWLRKANDEESRARRRSLAQETEEAVSRGWYYHDNARVSLLAVSTMEASTEVVTPKDSWNRMPFNPAYRNGATRVQRVDTDTPTVLDAAIKLAKQGRRVAAMNAASAYNPGGGFITGGRHALEEAMCTQSTLYRSIDCARRKVNVQQGQRYIPTDGAVLSPRVEVFRTGTSEGYMFLQQPVELACVVSVAMPNVAGRVTDAPSDRFQDIGSYQAALQERWRAVLYAASLANATDLVCPDAGCGVYGNDVHEVGKQLRHVLASEFEGCFENVWLVGSPAFCNAVIAGRVAVASNRVLPPMRAPAAEGNSFWFDVWNCSCLGRGSEY